MARRLFFVEGVHSGRAEITGDDAAHLVRVLRVEKGQRYEISDNECLYVGEVETARKAEVVFRIVEKLPTEAPPVRLHLMPSLIKFDHFEWMIEKATELGVERITPVIAERSEYGLDRAAVKRMDRWRRIARESAQQCRRWRIPEVEAAIPFRQAVEADGVLFLLEEQSSAAPIIEALPPLRAPSDLVALLIGPEGGWAKHERASARDAGWLPVSLGPTILRSETAATAALAVIWAWWFAGFGRGDSTAPAACETSPLVEP